MTKPFPDAPPHPERICWGCDRYCPAQDMACGNGSVRTPHPIEWFGADWKNWSSTPNNTPSPPADEPPAAGPSK